MDDECESLVEKARYYDYDSALTTAEIRSQRINKPVYVYACGQHFHLTRKKQSAKNHFKEGYEL